MLRVFAYLFGGVLLGYVLPNSLAIVLAAAGLLVVGGQLLVKHVTKETGAVKKKDI